MRALVNFDVLYIGGGNARHVRLKLNDDTRKISNTLGVKGGVALWLGPGRES
jgi:polyphosphate glucokinase